MSSDRLRVLFISTGNAARSQMAEAMLRDITQGRVDAYSAGSEPREDIHPLARRVMREEFHLDLAGQYPKPIGMYAGEHFDYVIAVCNEAAEACPVFPGDPEHIHWFYDDPAAATGSPEQQYHAFETTARQMMIRLRTRLELPAISNRVKAVPLA